LELLEKIDVTLFYFINDTIKNSVLDWAMPFITNKKNWYIPIALVYILLIWRLGNKGRIAALLIIPVIFLSDQLSASVLKPFFQRTRPCVALENVHMLIGLKKTLSFPSAHAANSAAAATLFSYFFPKVKMALIVFAGLIGISRVYVGVHYPFDVICGALLGVICAFFVIILYESVISAFKKVKK
jgi:undecaprenyl-diphosphatase